MMETLPASLYRRILLVYLAGIGLITCLYGVLNARGKSEWAIGDWLINYEGGFIRRGLEGQIVWALGLLTHLPPAYLVVALQLPLYGVLFFAVWNLTGRSCWNWWVCALLLSPATLAFQVLDQSAGFRKEIIYFAGLSMLLLLLRKSVNPLLIGIYFAVILVFSVFSHEALAIYTPYYIAAILVATRSIRSTALISVIPLLLASWSFLVVARHPGDFEMAKRICTS